MDNELRKAVTTKLDDYFRYSLEIRPDEDIPACADDIMQLVHQSNKELLERLHRTNGEGLPKRNYDNVTDEAIDEVLATLQEPEPET